MRLMGDKATARETMKKANVPTVPGSDGLISVSLPCPPPPSSQMWGRLPPAPPRCRSPCLPALW
jgi:hypothetical protein